MKAFTQEPILILGAAYPRHRLGHRSTVSNIPCQQESKRRDNGGQHSWYFIKPFTNVLITTLPRLTALGKRLCRDNKWKSEGDKSLKVRKPIE